MKPKSLPSNTTNMPQEPQPPAQQPPPPPPSSDDQLTSNSSSSPYTITSSLSSSSSSLPPQAPLTSMPSLTQSAKQAKPSKQSSLLSLKSIESLVNSKNKPHASNSNSLCSSHKCLISIWSTWYCLLIMGLHIYLIHNRITDIVNLFSINNSDIFSIDQINNLSSSASYANNTLNMSQLNASIFFEIVSRICLVALSILFLILFLLCSLKPLGNYANDGVKFGRDFFYEKIQHNHLEAKKAIRKSRRKRTNQPSSGSDSCFTNLLDIIWRHFLPANSFCHLVSILLLIFSRIIFNETSSTLHSYSIIKACLTNKMISGPCLLNFFLTEANQSIGLFYSMDDSSANTFFISEQISNYKFELISICLAFISIYIRYGSVFWFTNKPLSFLITFIGFIAAVEQLFQLYSFVYIYDQLNLNEQIQWANYFMSENGSFFRTPEPLPVSNHGSFLSSFAASFEFTFLIKNKFTLLFLYFTLSMLVYLSATPAYVFSFLKYKERFAIEESLFLKAITTRSKKIDNFSLTSSSSSNEEQARIPIQQHKNEKNTLDQTNLNLNSTCCFNYCPHLIATIQLVLICASKLPFCYDYVIYFNKYRDFGVCLVIVVEILHTIMLIFIWLLLTLKSEWNMHLQTAFSICHWTYHLNLKRLSEDSRTYQSNPIKTIIANETDSKKLMTQPARANQADPNDYNDYNENNYNMQPAIHKTMNNYEQSQNKISTLLTYQQQNNELNRNSVLNGNHNNTINNIYASSQRQHQLQQQQRQNMIETKHKSLIEHIDHTNIYNANPPSDYLMNSETLYRNEIRKSIRNIMQQKRTSMNGMIGSTSTLVASASVAHHLNQQKHEAIMENSAPATNREPFYYHTGDTGKKQHVGGGVYLTSTRPTVIDNSSVKVPTITHILTSTICSTTTNPNANKNRSVLYLERRSSSSNEYESRV